MGRLTNKTPCQKNTASGRAALEAKTTAGGIQRPATWRAVSKITGNNNAVGLKAGLKLTTWNNRIDIGNDECSGRFQENQYSYGMNPTRSFSSPGANG